MNIDTSTVSAGSDIKSNILSSQVSKLTGNNAFKSQLNSISSNVKSENTDAEVSSDLKNDERTEDLNEDNSVDNDKKAETTTGEKTEKQDNKQENQLKNDEKQNGQQNNQQNNGQNQQNQASAELSDEINSILKLNGRIGDVNNIQNQKFAASINEDVYTSSPAIDYSRFSMTEGDALFFANLVTKTDMSMQSIAGEFKKELSAGNVQNIQKTAKVSSVLLDALADSMKTGKSFRIDFDKDVSVVMRVDKDGNLNANFIPGDKAVEAYLKNNISYLRQRFDEQNLPYNELTYSRHKRQNQDEEKRNNKENNNE